VRYCRIDPQEEASCLHNCPDRGLLATKNLLSKDEVRGLYRGASANLEPVDDPEVVRAREVLKEYADGL
jgi:hypothetical protein